MMDEDYYKILGIARNASQAEIQKAYRDLARKYHPDLNPEDKSAKRKFQRVQQAYDVLNDADKREMYDRYGSSFESMGAGGEPGGWRTYQSGPGGFEDVDFGQFFGQRAGGEGPGGFDSGFAEIFRQFTRAGGGPRARSRAARGADLHHEVQIPFRTAVTGGEARLSVRRPGGKVETIAVKIPAGVDDGKKIRLRGQGQPGAAGGQAGDLLITIRVQPHPCFRRDGKHLELTVPVTLAEAALGAKIDVPTPQGTITLTVPPATSSGKRLRIKGRGVRPPSGEAGDLYAEIQIVLPDKLDERSAELIREFDQRQSQSPRTRLHW
jgi:DnaJ-class molecular chaperone